MFVCFHKKRGKFTGDKKGNLLDDETIKYLSFTTSKWPNDEKN